MMTDKKYIKRNISMPDDLFEQIKMQAEIEGRSVSNMIARMCAQEIERELGLQAEQKAEPVEHKNR